MPARRLGDGSINYYGTKLSLQQRRALADAYVERARRGLEKTNAGWVSAAAPTIGYHSSVTILSLEKRGYLQLFAKATIAHITDRGAELHENLREAKL